jgi:hypothetical protein
MSDIEIFSSASNFIPFSFIFAQLLRKRADIERVEVKNPFGKDSTIKCYQFKMERLKHLRPQLPLSECFKCGNIDSTHFIQFIDVRVVKSNLICISGNFCELNIQEAKNAIKYARAFKMFLRVWKLKKK